MSDKQATLCTCPTEVHYEDCRVIEQWAERDALRAENERLTISHDAAVGEAERYAQALADAQRENRQLQGDVMDSDHNELVQLRAEVGRLTRTLDATCHHVARFEEQRDEARAENEHLKAEYAELNDLYYTVRGLVADGQDITVLIERLRKQIADGQAESERLRATLDDALVRGYRFLEQIFDLTDENERLRAALREACDELENMVSVDDEVTTPWRALLRQTELWLCLTNQRGRGFTGRRELQAQLASQEQRFREAEAEWVERYKRLEAALIEITELELEGGEASLTDAMAIADEALNPSPDA
jgi:hypothetical protein